MTHRRFPHRAIEALGYYVYLYVDPESGAVFYVGKGQGNRAFSHLADRKETAKARRIARIRRRGQEPRVEILKYGLSEKEALLVESTAIDLLDIRKLTNVMRGHGSRHGSRGSADDIAARLCAQPVTVTEPAMLINIRKAFRYGLTVQELYDYTRSAWKLGKRRNGVRYALSVYQGIVREVYLVAGWVRGGGTMRSVSADGRQREFRDRWEFVGKVAEDAVRRKYVGKSVVHYLPAGAQNPVRYVNC
jgi:hypothetical protein